MDFGNCWLSFFFFLPIPQTAFQRESYTQSKYSKEKGLCFLIGRPMLGPGLPTCPGHLLQTTAGVGGEEGVALQNQPSVKGVGVGRPLHIR